MTYNQVLFWRTFGASNSAAVNIEYAALPFEFPNVEVFDNNSCSACQSTLLLFLQRYGEILADYIPADERLKIAIGKGHESLPEGTFCIGQCTAKQKGDGMFAPGCPPVGSQIYKILKENGKPAP